jgi:hypothetical protein
MKTLKYILPVLFIISSIFSAKAGDSIVTRNITVEREYKPVIHDAGKINSIPKVLEPKVVKISPVYSEFNLPLKAQDQNIQTLPAAELNRDRRVDEPGGFARIGLGNHINTLANFAYPLVNTSDVKLDFSLNHLGTFGSKAHSTTKTALSFDKYFDSFDLFAGIGTSHEYLKYYGNNFNKINSVTDLDSLAKTHGKDTYIEQNLASLNRPAKQFSLSELASESDVNTFWRYNAYAGVRSLPLSTELRYQAELQYKSFGIANGLLENQMHTKATFDKQRDANRLGLDFDLYNLSYQSHKSGIVNYQDAYSVLTLNPFYKIENQDFNVRLGVKSSFSFVHGRPFNPSVDIHADWRVVPKYLLLYGGISGGYEVNTMDRMFSENRYLYNDIKVEDTYSPSELYIGLKLKPVYNLLIDGFIDYQQIDNQYFFINKEYKCDTIVGVNSTLYSNRFNVLYSAASLLKMGVRANYNLKNIVNVQLKTTYNSWNVVSEPYAWNKPKWEASLNTDFKVTQFVGISANVFYEGERFAKLGTTAIRMNPKVDINLGASYVYNSYITAFAKINNLINNHYQEFYGYDVQGFNCLFGVSFSF